MCNFNFPQTPKTPTPQTPQIPETALETTTGPSTFIEPRVVPISFSETEYGDFLRNKSRFSFVMAELKVKFILKEKLIAKLARFDTKMSNASLASALPTECQFDLLSNDCLDIAPVSPARFHHRNTSRRAIRPRCARVQAKLSRKDLDRIRRLRPVQPAISVERKQDLRARLYEKLRDKRHDVNVQRARDTKYAQVQSFASNDQAGTSVSGCISRVLEQLDMAKIKEMQRLAEERSFQSLALPRFLFEEDDCEIYYVEWHAQKIFDRRREDFMDMCNFYNRTLATKEWRGYSYFSHKMEMHADIINVDDYFNQPIAQVQFDPSPISNLIETFSQFTGDSIQFVTSCASSVKKIFKAIYGYVRATFTLTSYALNHVEGILTFVACAILYYALKEAGLPKLGIAAVVLVLNICTDGPVVELANLFGALTLGWAICNVTQPWQNKYSVNLNVNDATVQYDLGDASLKPFVFLIFGALTLVMGTTKIPDVLDYTNFVKKIDAHAKLLKGSKVIFDSLESAVNSICQHFGVEFCGFGSDSAIPDEVSQLLKELKQFDIRRRNEMLTNTSICEHVQSMYNKYSDFRVKYRSNRAIVQILDKVQGSITNLYQKAVTFYPVKGKNRIEPVTMMLTGGSGVGKSSLLYHIGTAVLFELGKITDDMNDEDIHKMVTECTYARMVEQEFWDGYSDQPCTLLDDFGQMKDSTSNPNLEFMELIRMSNSFPYPLHMAGVEQKANTSFKSRVVIATTNLETINPSSIASAEAVIRRIDMPYRVSIKPEFADGRGRLAQRFCTGSINTDVYQFHSWNVREGTFCSSPIAFDALISDLRDRMREKSRKFDASKGDIRSYLQKLRETDNPLLRVERENREEEARLAQAARQQAIRDRLRQQQERQEREALYSQYHATVPLRERMAQAFTHDVQLVPNNVIVEDEVELQGWFSDIYDAMGTAGSALYSRLPSWPKHTVRMAKFETLRGMSVNDIVTTTRRDIVEFNNTGVKPDTWTDFHELVHTRHEAALVESRRLENHNYLQPTIRDIIMHILEHELQIFEDVEMSMHISEIVVAVGKQLERWNVFKWFAGALSTFMIGASIYSIYSYIRTPLVKVKEGNGWYIDQYGNFRFEGKLENVDTAVESAKGKMHVPIKAKLESGKGKQMRNARVKLESSRDKQAIRKPARLEMDLPTVEQAMVEAGVDLSATSEVQAWKAENACDLATQLRRNQMHLYFANKETKVKLDLPPIKVLFIRGRDMLINQHYVSVFAKYAGLCNVVLCKPGSTVESHFDAGQLFLNSRIYRRGGEPTDVAVITFPKTLPAFKDLTNHIMPRSYLSNLVGNRVVMTIPDDPWIQKFGTITKLGSQSYRDIGGERHVCDTITTTIGSVAGDCGGAYILDEPSVSKRLVGFHFAGYLGSSCAIPLVLEDLEEVLTDFEYIEPVTATAQAPEVFTNSTAQYLGTVSPAPVTPSKSKLVRTEIFNVIKESSVKPARLYANLNDPESPMTKGIQKQFTQQVILDDQILDTAVINYAEMLAKSACNVSKMTILDIDTAIQGTDNDDFIKGINRSRSAGYPYCMEAKRGKTDWFGTDEWTLNSAKALAFKEDCAKKVALMEKSVEVPFIFIDTLKDETRPIEKVDAGKTRVFAAAPMDFIVIFRQYFMGFMSFMMHNRIYTESAVGIKAQSMEWHALAKHLLTKGNRMIAGDFSNFDGTLNKEILDRVLMVVESYYMQHDDYKPEHARVRECLWTALTNSYHLCCGHLYKLDHSQPSGNPMTAILNSMYNSIAVRYVWYMSNKHDFNDDVTMIAYGDDNIISVGGDNNFNQTTISEGFAAIGMCYTMETKQASAGDYRPLTEVSFLKRGFVFDYQMQIFIGPLELDSIVECFNWIHQTTDEYGVMEQNFLMANAELALHNADVFNEWIAKIQKAIAVAYGHVLPVRQQSQIRTLLRDNAFYVHFPNLQWA